MVYKCVAKKGSKHLLKLLTDEGKEKWATTTEKVFNYAKRNFAEDEECDFEYRVKNGQYFVDKILKLGKGSKQTEETEKQKGNTTYDYSCEDCGKELKDDKYKKCYTCNQKNPSKSSDGSGRPDYKKGAPYGTLLPEEATRRNKLATMSSACDAIKVMTGQVGDVGALGEMVIELYEKLYKKMF